MQRWRNVDDEVIRSIPAFYEYDYDANSRSWIHDGGNDMYDDGNIVSNYKVIMCDTCSISKRSILFDKPVYANEPVR